MGKRRRAKAARPVAHAALPDFSRLPDRVAAQDMVTTQEVTPAPDPRGGRDTDTEFMLRNAGGF
jgi:hypothetical protein